MQFRPSIFLSIQLSSLYPIKDFCSDSSPVLPLTFAYVSSFPLSINPIREPLWSSGFSLQCFAASSIFLTLIPPNDIIATLILKILAVCAHK